MFLGRKTSKYPEYSCGFSQSKRFNFLQSDCQNSHFQVVWVYIACSKNWEWFKDILIQTGVDRIPGPSYTYAGWSGYQKFKEFEVELNLIPSAEIISSASSSSTSPK